MTFVSLIPPLDFYVVDVDVLGCQRVQPFLEQRYLLRTCERDVSQICKEIRMWRQDILKVDTRQHVNFAILRGNDARDPAFVIRQQGQLTKVCFVL